MAEREFKYDIIEEIATLSEIDKKGWRIELNLVSWNGADPKFDIRRWAEGHESMGKGISLSIDEATVLCEALQNKLGM